MEYFNSIKLSDSIKALKTLNNIDNRATTYYIIYS